LNKKQEIKELKAELELVRMEKEHLNLNIVSLRHDYELKIKECDRIREQLSAWNKVGKRIMYNIAYDLVVVRTHRERNEQMRHWFATLKDAVENIFYTSEMDDIPF